MALQISCPSCARALSLPDELVGHEVRCPSCQSMFTAEAPKPPSPVTAAPVPTPQPRQFDDRDDVPRRPRPRDEDEEDDDFRERSRRRRRYDDDYEPFDGRPHRGTLVMVLGIIGLVVSVIGMCVYQFVTEPLAFGLSLTAWILGQRDLAAMKAGEMDPAGREMTNAGWICGMIGTGISTIAFTCFCGFIVFYVGVLITAIATGK